MSCTRAITKVKKARIMEKDPKMMSFNSPLV